MKKVQTLFVVVVVWRLGGKKEEGLLFVVEKEKPKIKKKCKNLSPFLGFTFSSRGQGNKKKKKAISSLPNCFSPGPTVVEEEDLEDLHHHGDV